MTYGPWVAFHVCVKCGVEIKEKDRMYNNAICPHCGHSAPGTICETIKKARRKVETFEGNGLLYRKKKVIWEYKK